MSCYIMRPESILTIANSICEIYTDHAYNSYGLPSSGTLWNALCAMGCAERNRLNAIRVAEKLYALNVQAFDTRYNEVNSDSVPDFRHLQRNHLGPSVTDQHIRYVEQVKDNKRVYQPWVYKLLSMLDCYAYQTAEDATYSDPIRLGVVDLSDTIRQAVTRSDERYPGWWEF